MTISTEKLAPIHPGEVLLEEFLKPMGLSQNQVALSMRVPARRINEIVHGKRRITADTALRLARQNELNRALAEFCLDLVREESEIFKRCVLDDPSGCYGEDALRADRGPGGVLVKQA